MQNLSHFKEVFVSNQKIRRQIHRLLVQGKIRKLSSKLYTKNLKDNPDDIIRRHLWQMIGEIFPSSIISGRIGIENRLDKTTKLILS